MMQFSTLRLYFINTFGNNKQKQRLHCEIKLALDGKLLLWHLRQDLSKLVEQSLLMLQGRVGSMVQGVNPPQGIAATATATATATTISLFDPLLQAYYIFKPKELIK